MSSVFVDGRTASLIERSTAILEAKEAGEESPVSGRTRRVPTWLPTGEEVTSVKQAAVLMGLPTDMAAAYVLESKDASPDLTLDAMSHLTEVKVVRKVRTEAGRKRFGQAIGTIIVRDGLALHHIKLQDDMYDATTSVKGDDGNLYHVTKDPDTGNWIAMNDRGMWDNVVVDHAKTEEEALQLLDRAVNTRHSARNMRSEPLRGSKHSNPSPEYDALPQNMRVSGATTSRRLPSGPTPRSGKPPLTDNQNRDRAKLSQQARQHYDNARGKGQNHRDALSAAKQQDELIRNKETLRKRAAKAKNTREHNKIKNRLNEAGNAESSRAKKKPGRNKPKTDAEYRQLARDTFSQNMLKGKTDAQLARIGKALAEGKPNAEAFGAGNWTADEMVAAHGGRGFDPNNLKRSGMPAAGTVKVGDIVAPPWATDYPAEVVKVGPITPTGRVTLYYRGHDGQESRQTYKATDRLVGFAPKDGGSKSPKAVTPSSGTGSGSRGRPTGTSRTSPSSSASGTVAPSSSASDNKPVGSYDRFDMGGGASVTVHKTKDGWATRHHTGRVSSRGTLYHHIKKHDSYESALAYAQNLAGVKPEPRDRHGYGDKPGPGAIPAAEQEAAAKRAKAKRMEARNAQNAADFPVGSQVTTTVHGIGGRSEDVTGEVTDHRSGAIIVKTPSHGELAVERDKARKVGHAKPKESALKGKEITVPGVGKLTIEQASGQSTTFRDEDGNRYRATYTNSINGKMHVEMTGGKEVDVPIPNLINMRGPERAKALQKAVHQGIKDVRNKKTDAPAGFPGWNGASTADGKYSVRKSGNKYRVRLANGQVVQQYFNSKGEAALWIKKQYGGNQ